MLTAVSRTCLLAIACLLAACAGGPPSSGSAPPGAVSVSWADPAQFKGAQGGPPESAAMREAWLSQLGRHLAERAATVLPPDQKLQVRFTDVQRAGRTEPWRGPPADQVRIVRDIYPPRITLEFRLLGADGRLLQSGRRELRDPSFLMRPSIGDSDPLVYEKRLLNDWVDKDLKPML